MMSGQNRQTAVRTLLKLPADAGELTERKRNWVMITTLVVIHMLAAAGLWRLITAEHHIVVSIAIWALAISIGFISVLGITVGYHRLVTHVAFTCRSKALRRFLAITAAFAGQGEETRWVPIHRVHHMFEDEPGKDPHTPYEFQSRPGRLRMLRGLFWAHVGWMTRRFSSPVEAAIEQTKEKFLDPQRSGEMNVEISRWQARHYAKLLVTGFIAPAVAVGLLGFVFGGVGTAVVAFVDAILITGFLRMVFFLTLATWSVNSLGHWLGTRPMFSCGHRGPAAEARNCAPLIPISVGEWAHGNHHRDKTWAYFGGKLDPGRWFIALCERFGMVSDINKTPQKRDCPSCRSDERQEKAALRAKFVGGEA